MPIPPYEALMPMVLKLGTQERHVQEAIAIISDQLRLTEDERMEKIPSGTDKLINNRVHWAITYLAQAGLIRRPKRAHFEITDDGRAVLQNEIDNLDLRYLKKIPSFQSFMSRKRKVAEEAFVGTTPPEPGSALSPEEVIGRAYEEIEAELGGQILERTGQNTPAFFEKLVVRLLAAMGYGHPDTLTEAIGKVGDGGIDGIIHQDRLGLDAVYIQAKRYAPNVTVTRPDMQAFVGTLAGVSAHKGVFVTTSRFSPGALDYLRTVSARVVTSTGRG